MNKNNIWHLLTPEQQARLLEVLKRRQGQPPAEYRPTYGELRAAWKAKNNIK
ncbi:hypothetical protein H6G04_16840 [Calothrix membranacea FACHB-236]|nr:hypothetical protein [Calothrix membranacea FACHB-236]